MAAGDDKTEAATPKRRRDARKKGQVAKSSELSSLVVMLAITMELPSIGANAAHVIQNMFIRTFGGLQNTQMSVSHVMNIGAMICFTVVRAIGPLVALAMVCGVVSNIAQTGPMLALERLQPNFSRLNPLQGIQRFVSATGFVELAKSIWKVGLIGYLCYTTVRAAYPHMLLLSRTDIGTGVSGVLAVVHTLILRIVGAMFILAALDYAYQRYNTEKQLRMTKEEVRQEFKQTEGSPLLKSRMRAKMRQMARKRMMANVPSADVVVTNPTHFAVALKYEAGQMRAPRVVAKGQDLIALKIRELAQENDIPIVENPPLARAIYKQTPVDGEIPPDLYAAVAEVLAFVYKINMERAQRGIRRRRDYSASTA